MSKINLDTTTVESREQRLGTVVCRSGSASDLVKQSRRCDGNGKRCGVCDYKGPFTQGLTCSEQMVECQAGNVRGAVLIQHAPIGCATSQSVFNSIYRNGLAIRGLPVENVNIVCTNKDENDVIFGRLTKLRGTVEDVWDHFHPKAIFIGTSCATGIIGDDVDSVASEYTKSLGIPVIPLYCEGFRSKQWSTGFDATQHGILNDREQESEEKAGPSSM